MTKASPSVAWERILPPATLLVLSLVAAGPLWGAGLLNTRGGGDSPFLLLRTHQLAANLQAGVFPVRWMADAAYGFGYPFFSYYAALPYYLAALLGLIGLDILAAIKLTQTLFLAASALAMYRWAEQVLHSRPGAWLAAVAYTSAPYHLVNLYVRGDSLSEFAAFAFYPLILWGFDRLASRPSVRRTLFPAVAYAGLIVTHNISALIFSPFILLYVVFHVTRMGMLAQKRASARIVAGAARFALSLLIALLLSAWYWVPALAETEFVQLRAQTGGYFFYANHFRGTDLVQRSLLFDFSTGRVVGSPFAMGLAQAALALAGGLAASLGWVRYRRATRRDEREKPRTEPQKRRPDIAKLAFVLLGLLLSTWLMTPLSRSVWASLPLLPMVQFPWRFLSVQAAFTALLTGAGMSLAEKQPRCLVWMATLALGVLLISATLIGLRPTYLAIGAEDVNPERLQLYELFTGNIGSTIRHEYLPTWVEPRPHIGSGQLLPGAPPRAIAIEGALITAERLDRKPTRRIWRLEAGGEGAEVAFPLYYWPGWQAVVDGIRLEAEPTAGSGYLSLQVPPGRHTVELRLGRTPLRLGAEAASLISVGVIVFLCARGLRPRAGPGEESGEGPKAEQTQLAWFRLALCLRESVATYAPFLTILLLILAYHPRVSPSSKHDLTMDFENMPYLHHNPRGVPLGGWQLINYWYGDRDSASDDVIAAGTPLAVALHWRRSEDSPSSVPATVPGKLRLVPPAAVRQAELPARAEAALGSMQLQAASGVEGSTTITLSVPQDTPPGIYLLQIDDGSTQPPSPPVYLRPVWVENDRSAAQEPVLAVFADGALRLHDVQATHLTPDRLQVDLDWSARNPVAANYGLSLRLTDTAGNGWLHQGEAAGYDAQPGQGFLPTSLWPLGGVIDDRHVPAVLPGAPPGDEYTLGIDLYQVATWESVGQYTTTVTLTKTWQRPDEPIVAQFGDELVLSRIETPPSVWQGESLEATAYWSPVKRPSADFLVQWQLDGPGRTISDAEPLAPGSSPKDWPTNALIAGRASLPIPPTFPPGVYTLSLTVREPTGGTRIDSYTHPAPVAIRGRERVWDLPEMDTSVGGRFGEIIELAGYDLTPGQKCLRLTLYWQALETPDQHYMYFVHLADQETGEPVSQVDAMPRGFNYPTGQWAPGEVVSDEVELITKGVPGGWYDLAVGWYDPNSGQRLRAADSEGMPLADDRLLLPHSVRLP